MRDIKFRAWNGVEMVQNVAVIGGAPAIEEGASNEPDIIVNGKSYSCDWDYYQPKSNWKLMQYTGLKDKNGKEIFEGDVLRTLSFVDINDKSIYLHHAVEWSEKFNGWFARNLKEGGNGDGSLQLWVYAKEKDFEIIGNIHENPKLLEK